MDCTVSSATNLNSKPISASLFSGTSVPRRQCGRSELNLPVLGMGCWAYGNGEYWGAQSQRDVDAVVRCAVEQGCNFFDTAESYNEGASEAALGLALRGIPRDKVLIGTKISPSNVGPEKMMKHLEASLRRLQTDYVDLYMVHWPITAHSIKHFTSEEIPAPSVAEAFADLDQARRAGKVRYIGVSNFGMAKLDEALATGVEIVINELPYSLLSRAIEMEILPFCREKGVGVLGYMSLLQGVLTDSRATLAELPEWRRRTRHFDSSRTSKSRHGLPGAEAETNAALESIRTIARKHGMPVAELALKWAFAGNGITSSLCGSRNLKQLQMNIKSAAEFLDQQIVAELNRATQPLLEKLGPSFDYYENPANDRTR
jgi:aryl-alcohol dehydrogenase-like predicted oxidoreductase